jgi:hypothetical protein
MIHVKNAKVLKVGALVYWNILVNLKWFKTWSGHSKIYLPSQEIYIKVLSKNFYKSPRNKHTVIYHTVKLSIKCNNRELIIRTDITESKKEHSHDEVMSGISRSLYNTENKLQ